MITPTPPVVRARWAIAVIFAVHGCVSGSFAARIPWIKDNLGWTRASSDWR